MRKDVGKLASINTVGQYALGVGVHNAITALLAQRAGFQVLWLSSLEVSTEKALPDVNVITLSEIAEALREIKRATTLPIIVDADNGYGSDETAMRAAEEFCFAGATAICLEDNAFPKRNSFYTGVERRLEDSDTFSQRIRKVRRATGSQLGVVARTEALVAGLGVQEAISRARAYIDAGADAIFVQTSQSSVKDLEVVLREITTLTQVITTTTTLPLITAPEFHEMGADIILFPNVVIRTIIQALQRALTELRMKQRLSDIQDMLTSLDDIFELTQAYGVLGEEERD